MFIPIRADGSRRSGADGTYKLAKYGLEKPGPLLFLVLVLGLVLGLHQPKRAGAQGTESPRSDMDMTKVPVSEKNLLARIRFKLKQNGQRFLKARAAATRAEVGARFMVLDGQQILWRSDDLGEFSRMLGVLDDAETLEENES